MKTIKFRGDLYNVPEWVNFMAVDRDRTVYAYEKKPFAGTAGSWETEGQYMKAVPMDLGNWRHTMRPV